MSAPAARLRIGLTGGIGSGKSAVAELLAAHGVAIVDADQIAHTLTAPQGAAMPRLIAAFGPDICTPEGALDRAAMRALAFADAQARQRLESILHPMIADAMRAAAAQASASCLVLVVPLLVEHLARWRPQIDQLWVVDCPQEQQIARVQARSGLEPATVAAILAAQATRAQRLAVSDVVIDNSADLSGLARQVAALHAKFCAPAHRN